VAFPVDRRRARRRVAARKPVAARGAGVSRARLGFAVLLALIGVCVIGGGSARPETTSLLYLRPIAALLMVVVFATAPAGSLRAVRTPLLLLAIFALLMIAQLIPLPPGLWVALPGHDRYAVADTLIGSRPWRALSLTPDLTWNSLIALIVPAGVLIGIAQLDRENRKRMLLVAIGLALSSAVLGIVQMTAGAGSPFYLYRFTNPGLPVGWLANRNHEAVWLAATLPLLRVFARTARTPEQHRSYPWIAAGTGLFLVLSILVTGSRAGFALALVALVATYALAPVSWPVPLAGPRYRWRRVALFVVPIVPIVLALYLGRAVSLDRLFASGYGVDELRFKYTPLLIEMTRTFLPFGSGFGSFDAVFRGFEPDSALRNNYFNHAHNDLIELTLNGGIAALALLAAFLWWVARRSVAVLRPYRTNSGETVLARAGLAMILVLLAAGLTDYPLRTPLMMAVFALACGFAAPPRATTEAGAKIASGPVPR